MIFMGGIDVNSPSERSQVCPCTYILIGNFTVNICNGNSKCKFVLIANVSLASIDNSSAHNLSVELYQFFSAFNLFYIIFLLLRLFGNCLSVSWEYVSEE